MKALSNITVIDLTHMLSGPYAGMLLADLGADTIKVEPLRGEATRELLKNSPEYSREGMGAYFLTLNRNKKSVAIDLKSEQGREVFYKLVEQADVVLNNFGTGVPERLGIDYEQLAKHNPRIITCSITGFGETGPDPKRPAFDLVAQGMGGGMSITGEPGGEPLRAGIPIGDLGGGVFAVIGILSALQARQHTGRGQHVDISMMDCQLSLLNYMGTMQLMSGIDPGPMGNSHFVHVPYGTFRTKSRYLIIAVLSDKFWENLVELLDDDDLRNPEFATQPGRWAAQGFINARIQEHFDREPCEYWLQKLGEYRIPCAPVNKFSDAFNDPQAQARNMVVEVPLATGEKIRQPGNPVKFSDTNEESYSTPPTIGQNTNEILCQRLGLSVEQVEKLRGEGVIN
ncbi:CoA transferase [Halioxenophilus sp. WMMB6]|uniref:CaiB/BaiF CoA transferase family protein n=1 Tax=Halioxenophilus sp. WMMB6 TaxID=3073815 RepID=UPI00295F36C8|nr:CoA transferase [Halioxenophilus sp. WMMB6]